jgi:formylglycine-generating enzyme required for sulfatase activity
VQVDGRFFPRPGYENHPVVMVSWFGAKAYCEYYDWRLPTEEEWERAARGADNRPYPWGNKISPQNANYYSSHDLFEKVIGGLGDTTPVGLYNGKTYQDFETVDSSSPFGLYDMAGNVWQWMGNVYPDQHYRYLRGGSKADYSYNLRVWMRNSAGPDYTSVNVGFRCVREPDQ